MTFCSTEVAENGAPAAASSLKLLGLCALALWVLRDHRHPSRALPPVLHQVGIPCNVRACEVLVLLVVVAFALLGAPGPVGGGPPAPSPWLWPLGSACSCSGRPRLAWTWTVTACASHPITSVQVCPLASVETFKVPGPGPVSVLVLVPGTAAAVPHKRRRVSRFSHPCLLVTAPNDSAHWQPTQGNKTWMATVRQLLES
jgi:hypothetical protein